MLGLLVSAVGLLALLKKPAATAATAAATAVNSSPAAAAAAISPTAVGNNTIKANLTADVNKLAGLVPVPASMQSVYSSEVTKFGDWIWGSISAGNSTVNGKT